MLRVFFVLIVSCNIILACNPDQDHNPLRDYPDSVQQGIPPKEEKPPPPRKPVPQDALIIDADDVMVFNEGVERYYDIKFRTFKPDLVTKIDFDGMPADFQDWTYDIKTSRLTWTPPLDFTEGEFARHFQLMLRLSAPGEGIGTVKEVEIIVYRDEAVPEIIDVTWPQGKIVNEGEKLSLLVEILDPDGGLEAPVLSILDKRNSYEKSGAALIKFNSATRRMPNPKPISRGRWQYSLDFVASGELTKDVDSYHFALQATSRFGARSPLSSQAVEVKSRVEKPLLSWQNQSGINTPDAIVYQGQNNLISFTVMAPNHEGRVQLNWETRCDRDLSGNAVCKCFATTIASVLNCHIDWFVNNMSDAEVYYNIKFEILNRGIDPGNIVTVPVQRVVRAIKKEVL
jgi:hypothetical protein